MLNFCLTILLLDVYFLPNVANINNSPMKIFVSKLFVRITDDFQKEA